MNRIDLLIQAGTKLALWQWLQARGLGVLIQDTDPLSPTFGDYSYIHTDPDSQWLWWNEPSGKVVATRSVDNTDPDNPIVTQTYFNGFYGCLRYKSADAMEAGIGDWVQNSTAISILEGFSGIGGEGITIVNPEDVEAHLESIGAPSWSWLGTGLWSDPRLWYLSPVMTGDEREFDGALYESLIDFNVWTPTTYPQGWLEIVPEEPEEPAIPEWAVGVAYTVGDLVTYQGTTYSCRQSHTSLAGWTPSAVLSLWLPQ